MSERKQFVEKIMQLFEQHGHSGYGGEGVTQLEHALQAAHDARLSGASPALIAAALLHDVGHLVHDLPGDAPERGIDDHHEDLAARWLSSWFGPKVIEPIRMHVAAKRYLVAIEPSYLAQLSPPSLVSLHLQGGPMSHLEMEAFRSLPQFSGAVSLRRWDDAAKVPGLKVPRIREYFGVIEEVLEH